MTSKEDFDLKQKSAKGELLRNLDNKPAIRSEEKMS